VLNFSYEAPIQMPIHPFALRYDPNALALASAAGVNSRITHQEPDFSA
jgi:hypothetical protein